MLKWYYFYLFCLGCGVLLQSEDSCLSSILENSQSFSLWIFASLSFFLVSLLEFLTEVCWTCHSSLSLALSVLLYCSSFCPSRCILGDFLQSLVSLILSSAGTKRAADLTHVVLSVHAFIFLSRICILLFSTYTYFCSPGSVFSL